MFTLANSRKPQSVTYLSQLDKGATRVSSNHTGGNHHGYVPPSDNEMAISINRALIGENTAGSSQDILNQPINVLSLGSPVFADSSLSKSSSQLLATTETASGPVTSAIMGPSHQDASTGATSGKRRKLRSRKPRIELSPDQPPTTHGNPRSRVYIACLQCRTRKIRCDGAKPICHNCKQRESTECQFDAIPKRRGPDKAPGARQRIIPGFPQNNAEGARRRHRTRQAKDTAQVSSHDSPRPQLLSSSRNHLQQHIAPSSEYAQVGGCYTHEAALNVTIPSVQITLPFDVTYSTMSQTLHYADVGEGYLDDLHDEWGNPELSDLVSLDSEPSLNFTRKVWWDSLLCLYLSPLSTRVQSLTVAQRDMAARSITSDLRFVFQASNYWFSFFHIPTFFGEFCDPARRERFQPCLVLALLAMATFWRSSDAGMGAQGRERALRFRDEAQAALEASINSRWIDETLVQAAWVLTLFEACAHPLYSDIRSTSALALLDSLVHCLSLTLLDVDDAETSFFAHCCVPPLHGGVNQNQSLYQGSIHDPGHVPGTISRAGCDCKALTLAMNWPLTNEHAPLWGSTPTWHATWTVGEIRKESCRRLCWSSMALAAGYVSCMAAYRGKPPDLFLTNPANYGLLLSGEFLARSWAIPSHNSSKDTIWALYDRCYLLWHGCVRMRYDQSIPDSEKAQFAVTAWLKADALEAALDKHTCNLERASLYQAREYIFNTRMCISHEYQRWVPFVTMNLFHRKKAEEWLTHQASVARRLMDGLHTVTGNNGNILAMRPFFVFWFMGQIERAMSLWEYDNSLVEALDVCKAFIIPTDYLTSLWPCPEQRSLYENLRRKVGNACYITGVCPPPLLDLKVLLLKSLGTLV